MKAKLLLLLTALLLMVTTIQAGETQDADFWKRKSQECAAKYQEQRDLTQKEIIKRVQAESDLDVQKAEYERKLSEAKKQDKNQYLFEIPILPIFNTHVGVTTEEVKGLAVGAITVWTAQPACLLLLLF